MHAEANLKWMSASGLGSSSLGSKAIKKRACSFLNSLSFFESLQPQTASYISCIGSEQLCAYIMDTYFANVGKRIEPCLHIIPADAEHPLQDLRLQLLAVEECNVSFQTIAVKRLECGEGIQQICHLKNAKILVYLMSVSMPCHCQTTGPTKSPHTHS